MSELLRIVRCQPQRTLLIVGGLGLSLVAAQALWRHFFATPNGGRRLPRLRNERWKLSEKCEIDISSLNMAIDSLEKLLAELEPNRFHSELGRGKYDLIASIVSRLRGVCSDLQKYVSDDFRKRVPIEDIARSVWNSRKAATSSAAAAQPAVEKAAGTLSVLSDDSFISACDEFVSLYEIRSNDEREVSVSTDFSTLTLYNQGLKAAERGEISYRKSRAEFCGCDSDTDFAAKLYCIRLAFRHIMDEPQTMQWLIQTGRIIMADLLRHDKRDPTEFFVAYDRMIEFLKDERNLDMIREELRMRKVESTNLWDTLFDLIILDAFEDLQRPPSAISALLRNSYISRSMKESTLNNLIWSMIKVKRQRLQIKDGFISHFYDISQILTSSLAMGLFGGSAREFQDLCFYFKEQVFGFIMEIFNPARVRFTSEEELTEDVKKLLLERMELLQVKLSNELLPV